MIRRMHRQCFAEIIHSILALSQQFVSAAEERQTTIVSPARVERGGGCFRLRFKKFFGLQQCLQRRPPLGRLLGGVKLTHPEQILDARIGRPMLQRQLLVLDRATETRVLADARSGGACVSDVVSHMIGAGLPFGGLGESGMGAYHGRAGFDAFSHQRAVLRRATWLDTPFRYPPQKLSLAGLKRAMRFLLGD
jgi:hypothetical protein